MLDKFNVEKQNIYITTQGLCAVACIKHQITMCYITMVNKRKTNTTKCGRHMSPTFYRARRFILLCIKGGGVNKNISNVSISSSSLPNQEIM